MSAINGNKAANIFKYSLFFTGNKNKIKNGNTNNDIAYKSNLIPWEKESKTSLAESVEKYAEAENNNAKRAAKNKNRNAKK